MHLIVESSKPRLCHNERFNNLWIKNLPFMFETLKDIHRTVQKNSFMATCDEKSCYDHVKLNESFRTYLEFNLEVN